MPKSVPRYEGSDSLREARGWLEEHVDTGGCICPTCGRFCKTTKRKLNAGMAQTLIRMYKYDKYGWMNVHKVAPQGREEGKLAFWGLLDRSRGVREDGAPKSHYRLNTEGRYFTEGLITVPAHIILAWDGRFLGLDPTEHIDIYDAIDNKFDYAEMMRS